MVDKSTDPLPDLRRAVDLLLAGDVVAIPTETVYGLGADARNPVGLAKIFATKGRPADHPLIVHLPGDDYLEQWAIDIPSVAWELAEQFWPGPLTLILKRHPSVLDAVTGGQDTVGLRVPGHPLALSLLREFASAGGSGGIAAPSANRFGRISPTTAQHVKDDLGDAVPLVLDGGASQVGIESTIVDLSRDEPVILRPGMISAESLALVLGLMPDASNHVKSIATPRVSGSMEAHYAPRTPLRLMENEGALQRDVIALRASGKAVSVLSRHRPDGELQCWIPSALDANDYSHDLYAHLRLLDASGADCLLIENVPAEGAWAAVADRLRRAAVGAGH